MLKNVPVVGTGCYSILCPRSDGQMILAQDWENSQFIVFVKEVTIDQVIVIISAFLLFLNALEEFNYNRTV